MNPTIPVTIKSKDGTQSITFAVWTEEEKAECERLAYNAHDIMRSTEIDGGGRKFEVIRADHAKIYERLLNNF